MGNGPDLLETEQRIFDDTDGGRDGSTELAIAYTTIANRAFDQAVMDIKPDVNLEAAKNELEGNNQSTN